MEHSEADDHGFMPKTHMKMSACGITPGPANEGGVADPQVNLCVHRGSIRLTLARNMTDVQIGESKSVDFMVRKSV